MKKLSVVLSFLLLVIGAAPKASAQTSAKDRARLHFNKGFAYYQNGEFLKAVKELRIAYKIRPIPVVLFYIGMTFKGAGLEDEAARALWKFLDEATLTDKRRPQAVAALKAMGKGAAPPRTGIGDPETPPDLRPRDRVGPRTRPGERPRAARRRKVRVRPGEIIHEPVEDARPKRPMVMEAELPEDFGDWARLYIYYRPRGAENFTKKSMKADRRGIYHGCIPARHLVGSSVQYYIEAMGRTGKRKAGSGTSRLPNIISLSEEAPLQPGGRLKGCPDEEETPGGPGGPGARPVGPAGPGPGGSKGMSTKKLKLIGFIATAVVSLASFGAGVGLALSARGQARDMATIAAYSVGAGGGIPVEVYSEEIQRIEKQGKAMDSGAIFCYVLGVLATAGSVYLALDYFGVLRGSKKETPDKQTRRWQITPSFGPRSVGLTGGFSF